MYALSASRPCFFAQPAARSGTELVWKSDEDGSCWADNQSVRGLSTAQVGGYVRVDFVMDTSECGDSHAFEVSKFVKLGAAGIEWAHDSK